MLTEAEKQAQRDAFGDEPRKLFERMIEPARAAARECGYALAVHGSLRRDIDLVAVPWVAQASEPQTLVRAISAAISSVEGLRGHFCGAIDQGGGVIEIAPAVRPHGRLSWVIGVSSEFHSTQGHPWIDLSVIAPTGNAASEDE